MLVRKRKLTMEEARQLREDHFIHGMGGLLLGRKYGISRETARYIILNLTYKQPESWIGLEEYKL